MLSSSFGKTSKDRSLKKQEMEQQEETDEEEKWESEDCCQDGPFYPGLTGGHKFFPFPLEPHDVENLNIKLKDLWNAELDMFKYSSPLTRCLLVKMFLSIYRSLLLLITFVQEQNNA